MKCTKCGNELPNGAMFCDNCGTMAPQEIGGSGIIGGNTVFCGNCGAKIEAGTEFCGVCGSRVGEVKKEEAVSYVFCGNCGAKNPETAVICGACGKKIYEDDTVEKVSDKKYGVIIAVLVGVVLILAAAIGGYLLYNSFNDSRPIPPVKQTPAPAATTVASEAPSLGEDEEALDEKYETYYVVNCKVSAYLRESPSTEANILTEMPVGSVVSFVEATKNGFAKIIYSGQTGYALQVYLSNDINDVKKEPGNPPPSNTKSPTPPPASSSSSANVVSSPTYYTYNDSYYNFSCPYPSHFRVYNDSDKFVRYSLTAPDNTATLKICATGNSTGLTPQKVLDNFVSSYPGNVDYQSKGDDWCAVSTKRNGQCHYGYFKVQSDKIRGFEMHHDSKYSTIYNNYIDQIYAALKLN